MFDGSVPVKKTGDGTAKDVTLHFTLIVDIFKGEPSKVLKFVCSASLDSIEIQKVFMRGCDQMVGRPYMSPGFKELNDELQSSLYEFLDARGLNDNFFFFFFLIGCQ